MVSPEKTVYCIFGCIPGFHQGTALILVDFRRTGCGYCQHTCRGLSGGRISRDMKHQIARLSRLAEIPYRYGRKSYHQCCFQRIMTQNMLFHPIYPGSIGAFRSDFKVTCIGGSFFTNCSGLMPVYKQIIMSAPT